MGHYYYPLLVEGQIKAWHDWKEDFLNKSYPI